MGYDRVKAMKELLMNQVEYQLSNIQEADCHELGAAIDMIKDLAEASYYCTITDAMLEKEKEETHYAYENKRYYTEKELPISLRDEKEGRSPLKRRRYMEAKEAHTDEAHKMKELEDYMQELTSDIAEMIKGASPNEKALLQKKISSLANKVEQLNA